MLLSLRNNVYIWQSEFAREIDEILENVGFTLIDFPWEECELLPNDLDHFTQVGNKNFVDYLVRILEPLSDKKILILADSTLGYWDSTSEIPYDVISCCGVGYTTQPINFRSLIWDMRTQYDIILMIGGWNDKYSPMDMVSRCVERFVRTLSQKIIKT